MGRGGTRCDSCVCVSARVDYHHACNIIAETRAREGFNRLPLSLTAFCYYTGVRGVWFVFQRATSAPHRAARARVTPPVSIRTTAGEKHRQYKLRIFEKNFASSKSQRLVRHNFFYSISSKSRRSVRHQMKFQLFFLSNFK